MIPRSTILIFATLAAALQPAALAQDGSPFGKKLEDLTAPEILKLVQYSYTLNDQEFPARLRKHNQFVPFTLSLRSNYIRLRFAQPPQAIHLDTAGEELLLREVVEGSNAPVPAARYGEFIRGTDITYEDLAMRFLYWPDPELLEVDRIKTRQAWKLRVNNPDARGPYGYVLIWIDQQSGGLIQLEGYDRSEPAQRIKDFEVTSGRKIGDVWMADVIRVRSFQEDRKRGVTWLEIKPEDDE